MTFYGEIKHVFLAAGLAMALLTPFLFFLTPGSIANILYFKDGAWIVQTDRNTLYIYAAGYLLFILAPFMIGALGVTKRSAALFSICLLAGGSAFYIGAQPYTSISSETISFRELFSAEDYHYEWSEIEQIVYYIAMQDKPGHYEFQFRDGRSAILENNSAFIVADNRLQQKLADLGIVVKRFGVDPL